MTTITQTEKMNRAFRRAIGKLLKQSMNIIKKEAVVQGLDRYRKHFYADQHALFLLFHGVMGYGSLRQSYAMFKESNWLEAMGDLGREKGQGGVSFSQLAHSNTTRDADFLKILTSRLMQRVKKNSFLHKHFPKDLRIIDSTCLKISPLLSAWAAGLSYMRVQVQHQPSLDLPEKCLVTTGRKNDCQGLDEICLENEEALKALLGCTLVEDLGYYSHRRQKKLLNAGVHLVFRRHKQANIEVQEDYPIQHPLPGIGKKRITLLQDQKVIVGSANNRAGDVLDDMRLVTAEVLPARNTLEPPIIYEILTDRWDLDATSVILFYLWRWEIELFFRWLKSVLRVPRLLGYSQNAILLSVWLALSVHLIYLLLAAQFNAHHRSVHFYNRLRWHTAKLERHDFCFSSSFQLLLPFPDDYG